MCGGTAHANRVRGQQLGLSPRVRGNLAAGAAGGADAGSIPACAGEPRPRPASAAPHPVYPRVCGGTLTGNDRPQSTQGLSPRVRGNRAVPPHRQAGGRSIPACAGEPQCRRRRGCRDGVYPRVCGGTVAGASSRCCQLGLSPRVRGNPDYGHYVGHTGGSIPACAGEPTASSSRSAITAVYPRVCGGTGVSQATLMRVEGLSPRVRGNRIYRRDTHDHHGSIPACAGEPHQSRPASRP